MVDDQQSRVGQIEDEQSRLTAQMADLAHQWCRATELWLQEDVDQNVRRALESHPAKVKHLAATSRLTKLKTDVDALKKHVPQLVAKLFDGDAEIWVHLRGTVAGRSEHPRGDTRTSTTSIVDTLRSRSISGWGC